MDKKVTNSLQIEVPQNGFVDEGDGVVSFPNGLTITDGTPQRNGTTYDIDSLDVSRYGNQLTGDHEDKLSSLIGQVIGVAKRDGKVVVNKIRYAVKENPYARLAYDLLVGGFSKNFSTETIGPTPDHTGLWRNHELVGLSQVVTQNNYNAHINKVVHNSLEQAKHDGLDVAGIEEKILSQNNVEDENKMEENKDKKVEEAEVKPPVEETKQVEETKVEEETETKVELTEEKAPAVEAAQEEDGNKVVETPHGPNRDEPSKEEKSNSEVEKEQVETDNSVENKEVNTAIKSSLPVAEKSRAWDSDEAKKRVKNWAMDDEGNLDFTKYRKAFFWVDPAKKNIEGGYKLPYADVIDGELRAVWRGVAAAMGALNGAQGGVELPSGDYEKVYTAIKSYYAKFDEVAPMLKPKNAVATEEVEPEQKETSESIETEKETNKKDEKMEEKTSNSLTAEQLMEAVQNAMKPLSAEIAAIKEAQTNAFDKSAVEPEFKKEEVVKNDYKTMAFEDRYQKQVDAAWNAVKLNDPVAWKTLNEINAVNLDELKKAGIARNSITLDDLGNFVIPPEMYREIVGHRNDYTAIIDATEWRETLSLEFAWLQRVGDIDMKSVAIGSSLIDEGGPVSDDARLKPISEYSAVPKKSPLEELAAVTVVANSTTRFAAVDLLADAAAGYRNDYDRKRAQLVIARLEQAVDQTGFSVPYNPASDVDALTAWLDAVTEISDTTLNGTLIFNARTFAELKSRALKAGANGPLSEILTTGDIPTVFGYRFIIVPNDLMPSLGGSENINFTVDGEVVHINHAVFFAELSTFTGRTSGGLQYDISNSASYETGGVTKSAYQRNELVLRGSFFRGGAVRDVNVVAGVRQGAGPNVS